MSRRSDDGDRESTSGDETSAPSIDARAPSSGPASGSSLGAANSRRREQLRAVVVAVGLGLAGPVFAGILLLATGLALGTLDVALSPLAGIAVTLVLTQIVGFGSVIVGYASYRGYGLDTLGVRVPTGRELALIVVGGAGTLALALTSAAIMQALAIEGASNQAAELGAENPEIFLLLIPAAFLVIGPCEEGLYRGIVQGRLREAVGAAPAIAIAAALFAGVHVVALSGPTSARLATVALLLIPGLVFGVVYEHTGSLVVVAGMHAVYDALIFGILYLVVA